VVLNEWYESSKEEVVVVSHGTFPAVEEH
jgi:hypothetical protein